MAPHNTGARMLKARRVRARKTRAPEVMEVLPVLLAMRGRDACEVVERTRDDMDGYIDWSKIHPELNPSTAGNGNLPENRAARKRMQIGSILSWLDPLLPPGGTCVDFCAGSGHLGLVVAAARPDCTVVILEKKQLHCDLALKRIEIAGLRNARVICCQVSDFQERFDVGVGLHACGPATDLIHALCLAQRASYVLAPCCYGFIARALDKYKLSHLDHNSNGGMVAIDHRDMPADLDELPPAPGGGPGKGRLNEESVEARLRAEAVEARERCRRDNEQQAARERAAPMQGSVTLLDDILHDLLSPTAPGRALLCADRLRLKHVKSSFWGSGVSFPRSEAFRTAVQTDLFACIAGSADASFWATEKFAEDKEALGQECMATVDSDRCRAAEEIGYSAGMARMCGGDAALAGQKNQLLVGRPK